MIEIKLEIIKKESSKSTSTNEQEEKKLSINQQGLLLTNEEYEAIRSHLLSISKALNPDV